MDEMTPDDLSAIREMARKWYECNVCELEDCYGCGLNPSCHVPELCNELEAEWAARDRVRAWAEWFFSGDDEEHWNGLREAFGEK